MVVIFKCGHKKEIARDVTSAPICDCGERIVKQVSGATPKFTGSCQGPLVQR